VRVDGTLAIATFATKQPTIITQSILKRDNIARV